MSSLNILSQSFNKFYNDIETQISKISTPSLSSLDSCYYYDVDQQKNDEIKKGTTNASSKKIQKVIKAAKELNNEVKRLTSKEQEKNEKMTKKKPRSICFKSTMPPMWDENKLKAYIDNVMKELDTCIDLDHKEEEEELIEEKEKNSNVQVSEKKLKLKNNSPQNNLKRNIGTNVNFVVRNELNDAYQQQQQMPIKVLNNEKQVKKKKKTIEQNEIKSNVIEIPKNNQHHEDNHHHHHHHHKENPKKSLTRLTFSPLTVTSTNYAIDDYEKIIDYNCIVESGNLATNKTPKQMTKCILPTMSLKGNCRIQRIYQLEILPTRGLEQTELCTNKNIHFHEFTYTPSMPQQPTPHPNHEFRATSKTTTKTATTTELSDKKAHLILDREKKEESEDDDYVSKNTRNNKKKRKTYQKPSALNKLKRASSATCVNKNSIDLNRLKIELNDDSSSLIVTSTPSSSNDDDDDIREALKQKINHRKVSFNSLPTKNKPIRNETYQTNFNSFCEKLEDIFMTDNNMGVVVEINDEAREEKEIDEKISQTNALIKVSVDNIQKAGKLLEKYCKEKASMGNVAATQTDTRASPQNQQIIEQVINKSESAEIIENKSSMVVSEGSPMGCTKVDSSVQTINDKNVQTNENYNWKARHYFSDIFKNYSHLNFGDLDQTPRKQPRQLPIPFNEDDIVPFNTAYTDNEDVMELAHRFLRSIEKGKKSSLEPSPVKTQPTMLQPRNLNTQFSSYQPEKSQDNAFNIETDSFADFSISSLSLSSSSSSSSLSSMNI